MIKLDKIDKRKQYFCIVDTETTTKSTIADFAAVVVDRKGNIFQQMGVLVDGHYGNFPLFHDVNSADEIWTLKGLKKRNEIYKNMLNSGDRMLASVSAINRWLELAQKTYKNLIFVAYNNSFDLDKMTKTGIITQGFSDYFCMMKAAQNRVRGNKDYIQHCIDRKWLTAKLNFRTNAEAMAEFAVGHALPAEPHTALEDILYFELPIFEWLMKKQGYKKYSQDGYNWREWQLKDLVKPK